MESKEKLQAIEVWNVTKNTAKNFVNLRASLQWLTFSNINFFFLNSLQISSHERNFNKKSEDTNNEYLHVRRVSSLQKFWLIKKKYLNLIK
jgi:hypothetical protein